MRQTISPSAVVPRHYLQTAHDFEKLLGRIEQLSRCTGSPIRTVIAPDRIFAGWDKVFLRHQRALPQLFRALSERVLARSCGVHLVETVRCLVPLEERVYKILWLRNMIQRHHFSGAWQTGQRLLLLRIEQVLTSITRVLSFFITTVRGVRANHGPAQLLWRGGFGCEVETLAYIQWFYALTGSVSFGDYPLQGWRFLLQKIGLFFRSKKRPPRSPIMTFMVYR